MKQLLAVVLLLSAGMVAAATVVGSLEPAMGTWRVYRGTTYVCTARSEAAAFACASADAETRAATTRYQVRYPNRYMTVTYSAPPPAPVLGSATLSWIPPAQNTDGSALTDLAGYRVLYGTSPGALIQMIEIANPSLASYVVGDLQPGTYYFALRAYTSDGDESGLSNIASKVIQ